MPAMNVNDAAALAETFLRAHLAERHPPPPPDTSPDDDFATVLQRVEVDGERTLRFTFGIGMVFRMGDHRAPERINACLEALLGAHPELQGIRLEVTASTIEEE